MKTNNQRGKCAIDVTKNEKYCIKFDISLTTTCIQLSLSFGCQKTWVQTKQNDLCLYYTYSYFTTNCYINFQDMPVSPMWSSAILVRRGGWSAEMLGPRQPLLMPEPSIQSSLLMLNTALSIRVLPLRSLFMGQTTSLLSGTSWQIQSGLVCMVL